jgi:hypothetical protein
MNFEGVGGLFSDIFLVFRAFLGVGSELAENVIADNCG